MNVSVHKAPAILVLLSAAILGACGGNEGLEERVATLEADLSALEKQSDRSRVLRDFTVVGKEIYTATNTASSGSGLGASGTRVVVTTTYRVQFMFAGSERSIDYPSALAACYFAAELGGPLPAQVGEGDALRDCR